MHSRMTAGSFATVLGPFAGIAALLAGALPAQGADVPFTEHVISTTAAGAISVFATDVDGDGDIDILSGSQNDNKIAWYENDGGSPPSFNERVISTTAGFIESIFATDMDGDGDTDVLSASNGGGKIAWYENDPGAPGPLTFTEHVISTTDSSLTSVFATDLDGDGDTDVLSASLINGKITWYENDGSSPPTFTERTISAIFFGGGVSVFATDVDGDGDTDVLSGAFDNGVLGIDKIAWYENNGASPPAFTERVISTAFNGAISIIAVDVNGDGDTDVLTASLSTSKIAWYENDGGTPPTFSERVISTTAIGARSVFATDVDGDGDIDVLSASFTDSKIAWYENDGGSSPIFTERVITEDPDGFGLGVSFANGARSVFATDVDGDGDTDVLSASFLDNKIAWYENTTPLVPTELSALQIDKIKVDFGREPGRIKIKGEIGLPFGVDFSEVLPMAMVNLDVAGLGVLPDLPVVFLFDLGVTLDEWKYRDKTATLGIRKFDIDWKGARFKFKQAGLPFELKTQIITATETMLTLKLKPDLISGAFSIDFDGLALVNVDPAGNVTADVPVEIEEPGREFTLTLPFGLTSDMFIMLSGALDTSITVADHLQASIGRFRLDASFDGAAFPDGVLTTPREVDLELFIGAQLYKGTTMLGSTDLTIKKLKWK